VQIAPFKRPQLVNGNLRGAGDFLEAAILLLASAPKTFGELPRSYR
jgi:hypothetical protein